MTEYLTNKILFNDYSIIQRDFGVYVVNMFDTGQATRVLKNARFSGTLPTQLAKLQKLRAVSPRAASTCCLTNSQCGGVGNTNHFACPFQDESESLDQNGVTRNSQAYSMRCATTMLHSLNILSDYSPRIAHVYSLCRA